MHSRLIDPAVALLEAVAEYGGVNAAAEVLGRHASGLSRQIQRLSEQLGTPLLERRGRQVELTAAARALVAQASHLHAADERVRIALAEATDPQAGEIRIAAHVFAVSSIVIPALRTWRMEQPQSTWNIRESEPSRGQRLLAARQADVVISPSGPHTPAADHPRYLGQRIVLEPVDLIVPRDHALAERNQPVSLSEAAGDSWVMGSPGQGSREEIMAHCAKAGFAPAERHHAQDWTAVSALVAEGLGVSLSPRMAPTHPGVRRVSLSGPTAPARSILAITRRGAEQSQLVRATVTALRITAERALESHPGYSGAMGTV